MVRRVYEIPKELHERIKAFMASRNAPSEVDAVRWILGAGVDAAETEAEFRERIKVLPADEALKAAIGHPLCMAIEQRPVKRVILKSGAAVEVF